MKLSNSWNRFVYRLWAPVYDATVGRLFMPGRGRAMACLALQPGERVLIVGVGTGADLPLIPEGVHVTGIDLSPEMLRRARGKRTRNLAGLELSLGDAQDLQVEKTGFDAVILNLILSVVPDGRRCLQSALAALKPGGRAVIFDKFLPKGMDPSPLRMFLNFFSTLAGTDINRRLDGMLAGAPCQIVCDEPSLAGGMYRVVMLVKDDSPAGQAADAVARAGVRSG